MACIQVPTEKVADELRMITKVKDGDISDLNII